MNESVMWCVSVYVDTQLMMLELVLNDAVNPAT